MAKKEKNKSAFDRFSELYAPMYEFESFAAGHPEGKGDLTELVDFWEAGSKRLGIEDEDIEYSRDTLTQAYLSGNRQVFYQPGKRMYDRDKSALIDFAGKNAGKIIDGSDEKLLRELVLPNLVSRYKTDDDKYKNIEKIIGEETKLTKKLKKLNDRETHEEALNELIEARKKHYAKRYSGNKDALEILSDLISSQTEARKLESDYAARRKELDEALGKDIKGYLKSLNATGEDIAEIYGAAYRLAKEKSKNREE